jgi:hypothetical protein
MGWRRPELGFAVAMAFLQGTTAVAAALSFDRLYVDLDYGGNGRPGWVRAGDMDNDGDLDIVAGGGYALYVYESEPATNSWTRHGNLDGTQGIGANGGVVFDVDADGDLDVVCAQYKDDLGWWENPGPPLTSTAWQFHVLSNESRYLHDLIVADLDQDGTVEEFVANLNAGYWNASITLKWFRPGADPTALWESHTIEPNRSEGAPHGHAGMDVGDVDDDGNVDLAYSNGWYEAPDDPAGSWTWREVSQIYGISNALLRDMDGDDDLDLVVSAGHHGSGVFWLRAPDDPVNGSWSQQTVDSEVHHPECLAVLDLDEDEDLDIVSCDLFFGEAPGEPGWDEEVHNIYVFEKVGTSASWNEQNIAPDSYPSHLLQMVDMNLDGKMDIISEATGTSVVSYYENMTPGLGCIDDIHEPDDSCGDAPLVALAESYAHLHCDEDWVLVDTIGGATYEAMTYGLEGGADTALELYDPGCGAFVTSDDDSGPGLGSLLTWTALSAGQYALRSIEVGGYGNGLGYDLRLECILDCGVCSAPDDLELANDTVTTSVTYEACNSISAGTAYVVDAPGELTLRAGNRIVLEKGFSVLGGGTLVLEIDRTLR